MITETGYAYAVENEEWLNLGNNSTIFAMERAVGQAPPRTRAPRQRNIQHNERRLITTLAKSRLESRNINPRVVGEIRHG